MLVDGDRHVTDHVFVDAGLALEFCNDGAGALDVEQNEVRLAIAVDLVGEVLEAPGLRLGDLAIVLLDNLGSLRCQCIDLSLAQILARKEHVLVKSHVDFLSLRADRWLIRGIAGPLRLSSNPCPEARDART